MSDPLLNISPLDGRYIEKNEPLRPYVSEFGLMRYRLKIEIEWFIYLCNILKLEGTQTWSPEELSQLQEIYEDFSLEDAQKIKTIEQTTNHDVKAVEYFIRECFKGLPFEPYSEFVHFACTSEDINNLAYALMLKNSVEQVIRPNLQQIIDVLYAMAIEHKSLPMMARTHGQPATPTTLGKEFINIVARLEEQVSKFLAVPQYGKINGAVGNFNAHIVAYPEVDWIKASHDFIVSLGLVPHLYTTQIEPHDGIAEFCDGLKRINTIFIDAARDIWTYISLGYFGQKIKEGEVGSSTMPHKVNPIDFENSEGNGGIANALLEYFAAKLPISRLQRDLTDSTTLRNLGSALGYSYLCYQSFQRGLSKLLVNSQRIEEDLASVWELLAEPIQTLLRKYKVPHAYEKLKDLTRGTTINADGLGVFIENLELPTKEKERLKSLTPSAYTGLATKLVENYKRIVL